MAAQPDCPAELKQLLTAYFAEKPSFSQIRHHVSLCILHRQFNDAARATLAVNVRSEIAGMWKLMRLYYFQRGAREFEGNIPRGPIFRQILRRMQNDEQ